MGYFALENFRHAGVVYKIGQRVPDHVVSQVGETRVELSDVLALEPGVDQLAASEPDAPEDAALETREITTDQAIALMIGEIAALEGVAIAVTSKAQIAAHLFAHYIAIGLIEPPRPIDEQLGVGEQQGNGQDGDGPDGERRDQEAQSVQARPTAGQNRTALVAIAAAEGVTIDDAATKAQIIAAIEAARKAGAEAARHQDE